MRRLVTICIAVAAAVLAAGSPHPRQAGAAPFKIWVVNQLIANTMQGAPVDFSTPAGRAAVLSNLDAIQLASGGLIGLTPEVNASSGQPLILVKTDGSGAAVGLNGHGLQCSPLCDGSFIASPDPTDQFVVYTVVDAGLMAEGDTLIATAIQDLVTLDSIPLHVIGASLIETFAGGGAGDGNPPTQASVRRPAGLAVDGSGTVYIADHGNCRVRKVSDGIITSLAGKGGLPTIPPCPSTGDGGPASDASLGPSDVAVDAAGVVYVADLRGCQVRKIEDGVITTVYDGASSYCGQGLAIDASNRVLMVAGCQVWRYDGSGWSAIVGNGSCTTSGDGGAALAAGISPTRLALDNVNNFLYVSDETACRVRKVALGDATPMITTVVGTGTCGSTADPGPATSALLHYPVGVAIDSAGRLYIADAYNCRVRRVDFSLATPEISTVAGTGVCGLTADPGPATSAQLSLSETLVTPTPYGRPVGSGIAVDASDNLFISDTNNCLIRMVSGGTISTFAGNGACDYDGGDGGPLNEAGVAGPWGVAVSGGSVYVSQTKGCRIRRIAGGTISTVAGTGVCGFAPDGEAASTMLDSPMGIALGGDGQLYVAEWGSCRIRKINLAALPPTIGTIAGTGTCGASVDPGPALSAQLKAPRGLTVAPNGDVYVADSGNCIVRKISGGVISTVAGTGSCAIGPSGGLALSVALDLPTEVALDGSGNLFITDSDACVVRKLSAGTITTIAGTGYGAPGHCNASRLEGSATSIDLGHPSGLAIDQAGKLYFSDTTGCYVRYLVGGYLRTYVGRAQSPGWCAYQGDGEISARRAGINFPRGIVFDAEGNLYIADWANNRVRVVSNADIDGDGCSDMKEGMLVPPTDFRDRWDFYNVPVPALFAAPSPLATVRDAIVSAGDAQAVFGYFKKAAKTGSLEYEQDLNGNGIADGAEYDRSVVVGDPGASGPPNGIISATDAQLAFAQFKNGYKC